MGRTKAFSALLATLFAVSATAASRQAPDRLQDILPAEGLIGPSVVEFRRQSDLDPLYFLADENVLGLDGKAQAVFARYRADGGEALVLAVVYQDEKEAGRAQERFGRDFFSKTSDPESGRILEELESGDFAGMARVGPVFVVVLEAPSRPSCDGLLRRVEERARALR